MVCWNRTGWFFVIVVLFSIRYSAFAKDSRNGTSDGSEEWGYIEVRPKAHIFWWLYRSPGHRTDSWPLILWLQGGPGASGVGIGNFEEIGPLDTHLRHRNSTWLQKAHLLFVDSPVGTGFSYVEYHRLAVTSDGEAAKDLLTFLKRFLETNRDLQNNPLFIVGESYGGKHATILGLYLSKAISSGSIKLNFGGVALGDSWISPVDYVLSWGPLLKDVSRLDAADEENATRVALKIQDQLARADYERATETWAELENLIESASNNVDFYNFLIDSEADSDSAVTVSLENINSESPRRYSRYLSAKKNSGGSKSQPFDFGAFMNGVIRKKLKIIPKSVQWDGQGDIVFTKLQNDFMKDTIYQVNALLSRGVSVTIYNGQVDLICATKGTEVWVQKLKWRGLRKFNARKRTPLYCGSGDITKGFVKKYKNLQFFWILGAGHFVPVDQPCVTLKMLDVITKKTASHK